MAEIRGPELVQRYKDNYGMPEDSPVTEEMILRHWELEKQLRFQLLESSPDNRWEVFERCYSQLYHELEWLNTYSHADEEDISPEVLYANWLDIIGKPPQKIYEVGSGRGELVHFLATKGFTCVATEITRERGENWTSPHPNLSWNISDGIHLDQFEELSSYDVVLSDNVVEHMHPDDIVDHCKGVLSILVPGGRYVIATPHAHFGPEDVSRIFGSDTLQGMHLKEYTYQDLFLVLRQAGFDVISSVLRTPMSLQERFGFRIHSRSFQMYYSYLTILERIIGMVPSQTQRNKVAKLAQLAFFPSTIMIVARKPK